MNYAAVTAVSMRTLNRQRANIVLSQVLQSGNVLRPSDVSKRERIFERDGVLRWADDHLIGHCSIGVTLGTLMRSLGPQHGRTGSLNMQTIKLSELMLVFKDEAYILWFDHKQSEAMIVLKQDCTPLDQLKAWTHALLLAQRLRAKASPPEKNDGLADLRSSLDEVGRTFDTLAERLRGAGWDLEIAALETRAGTRATVTSNEEI
jgi:hypothetical protein